MRIDLNGSRRRPRAPRPADQRPAPRWRLLALAILLAAAVCACGNKGDLYLPDEAPPAADEQG